MCEATNCACLDKVAEHFVLVGFRRIIALLLEMDDDPVDSQCQSCLGVDQSVSLPMISPRMLMTRNNNKTLADVTFSAAARPLVRDLFAEFIRPIFMALP